MFEIGQELTINGKKGIICFNSEYNGKHYSNVFYEETNEYKPYEIIKDDQGYVLKAVTDLDLLNSLTAIWVAQELETFEQSQE